MGKMFKALEKAERDRHGVSDTKEKHGGDASTSTHPETRGLINQDLVSLLAPASLAAEQFRKLRVNLANIHLSEPPQTILITSAKEAEGKTIIAANLAITIAQEINARALLVETDLRSPTLSQWFGIPETKGLADYLSDGVELASIIKRTSVDKLSLIPGGSIKENPVELIGSKKMKGLIQELKSHYPDRYIIFDSSPLLATSEPNVMIKWVDAVLLIVKAGSTPREEIQQSVGHLKRDKVIGVVLNDLEFKMSALHSKYFGSATYYHRHAFGEQHPGKVNGLRKFINRYGLQDI